MTRQERQKIQTEMDMLSRQLFQIRQDMIERHNIMDANEWDRKDKIRRSLQKKIGYKKYLLTQL